MARLLILIVLFTAITDLARSEELTLLGGVMQNVKTDENALSWQLEYKQALTDNVSASIAYLNEGHVNDHHRDGHTVNLWAHTSLLDSPLVLSVGAGPYFYFDTTAAKSNGAYSDNHGWGALFSLAATWQSEGDWLYQVRINGVKTFSSIDTVSVMAGVGYYLESNKVRQPAQKEANDRTKHGRNELTFFLGQTVVNSFNSDKSVAASIEYRRRIARYLDGTIGWIYEGDNRLIRRNGTSLQIWGVKDYLDKRVSVGIGGGAYISIDRYYDLHSAQHYNGRSVSGIITLSTSYLINPTWTARVSWHRIVTNYDRDTDVILGGVGYRF